MNPWNGYMLQASASSRLLFSCTYHCTNLHTMPTGLLESLLLSSCMTPIARFIISFCSLVWTWTRIHQTNQHSSSSRLLQKGTEREKQEHSSAHAHSTEAKHTST
jgi:hypothetical protein